jgi:PIN domain nuclease of toxin-antitoxin system
VILLDTHALLWLDGGHRRARALASMHASLYISPVTVLELQVLQEAGRLRRLPGARPTPVGDPRWLLDDPPAARWFDTALELTWTRDMFDRLLVAHARLRGWRLATADQTILEHLRESERFEL